MQLVGKVAGHEVAVGPGDQRRDLGLALVLGVIVRGEHVAPISAIGCAVCLAGARLISAPGKSAGGAAGLGLGRTQPQP